MSDTVVVQQNGMLVIEQESTSVVEVHETSSLVVLEAQGPDVIEVVTVGPQGPQGPAGADGADGADGGVSLDTDQTISGAKTFTHSQGLRVSNTTAVDLRTNASGAILDSFTAGAQLILQTQSVARMRVMSSGNILIGTSTDDGTNKLQVSGSFNASTGVSMGGVQCSRVSRTVAALTSGTSWDVSSIPTWVKRVTITLRSISTSGGNQLILLLGDTALETSGYYSRLSVEGAASTQSTTALLLAGTTTLPALHHGTITLTSADDTGRAWVMDSSIVQTDTHTLHLASGIHVLSPGPLQMLRLTTIGSTDTFDGAAGVVSITYEG